MRHLVLSIASRFALPAVPGAVAVIAFVFMVLAASPGHASSIASVEEALKEKVYGDPDAPVTVVEYA